MALTDKDALLEKMRKTEFIMGFDKDAAISVVEQAPEEESTPEIHSFWDDSGKYHFANGDLAICCDNCGAALHFDEYEKYVWNYCPKCGARMDGETND